MRRSTQARIVCLFWLAALFNTLALAERVILDLKPGLTVRAEYHRGDADKPAVLILHGFLQTHAFPTVHNLANGLASAGYSVLTPTLSLGVTHRDRSLPCEAVHTHTVEDNWRELDAWLAWLRERGHDRVVFIGHSLGSAELLLYLEARRPREVKRFIAISLVESKSFADKVDDTAFLRAQREKLRWGEKRPEAHPLSFCKRFVATPQTFISYLSITPERILQAARTLRIPALFIMGGGDHRLGEGWIGRLQRTGQRVAVIPSANHFMDGEHEFDLLDLVLENLKAAA